MAIFILKHSSAAVARRTETAMLPQSSMRDHGPVFRTALVFIVFTCATIYNILQNQFVTYENPGAAANPPPSYFSTVNDISHDDDYEIVTTDYGWTTDKRDQFSQRKVSEEFFNAILSHPKYNPKTSWEELGKNPDPSKRLVVFLDIDTCIECNYPNYGATLTDNLAITVKGEKWHEVIRKSCSHIRRAAESPALKANKDSRLILLDCGDAPYYRLLDVCDPASNSRAASSGGWGDVLNNSQVIIASYGARQQDSRDVDIGLPPPAVKPMELLPYERYWIETCKSERRHYMFSFQGRGGFRRDRLKHLDNGHDIIVRIKDPESYWNTTGDIFNYGEVLRNSLFSAAPRGDCLYSYRFTEMMSAGTIPVVYADDWLPPFASRADPNRVLNWTKCAVFIREYALFDTVKILNMTPDDVRCEMQQCSLAFWDEFGSSREGWLKGILRWVNSDPGICKN